MSNARSMPEDSVLGYWSCISLADLPLYPGVVQAPLIPAGSRLPEEEMGTSFPGLSTLYRQHTAKERRRQNGS